ncbi:MULTISPECIES: hypothetical protein [unclassified Pseudomonas]|uniref:hypothetical protein n=1 Tax=Pseudomonas TaxID=286 RepID=UPI00087135B3|nr:MULTISPECIES: hypothetical protein [unclassified Pseudomonas]SCW95914.1 hypothetical protein SAMN03159481_04101 [Pseudomonas sp. NFACC56-3]SFL05600.1 hypothetical protein SAMN03159473_05519 [Pseudomonas sp. NFACC52]
MPNKITLAYVEPNKDKYYDTAAISDMIPCPGDIVTGFWGDKSYRVKERKQIFDPSGTGSHTEIQLEYI